MIAKIYQNRSTSRECYFVERHRTNGRSYGVGVLRYNTATGKDRWVIRTDISYKSSDIDDIFQFMLVGNMNIDKVISESVMDAVEEYRNSKLNHNLNGVKTHGKVEN